MTLKGDKVLEMRKLDKFQTQVAGTGLLGLIRGYQQATFLYQAFRTGVFDYLTAEPQSTEALAARMGCQSDRMGYLLDALTAMELAEKEGDRYRSTPQAAVYLRGDSSYFIGDLLDMEFSVQQGKSWEMLGPWLKGESNQEDHHPQAVFQPAFVRAMAQGVLSDNSVVQAVEMISHHPCFAGSRNVLDLGGGHGLFSLALQSIKPDLNITVFDLPQVKDVTNKYAQDFGGEVGFQPGNFYEDELPCNQDIVLAFDILHPVPTAQKEEVFAKVHKSLKSGGYLFYKLWFLDETRTKPRRAALFSLKCKITNNNSHVYTCLEAQAMLEKIGFKVEDNLPVGDNCSTILAARKE